MKLVYALALLALSPLTAKADSIVFLNFGFTTPQTFSASNSYSSPGCTDCSFQLVGVQDFNFVPQPFDTSLGTLIFTLFTISITGSASWNLYCPAIECGGGSGPDFFIQNRGIDLLGGMVPVVIDTFSDTGSAYAPPGLSVQNTFTLAPQLVGHVFASDDFIDPNPIITLESAFQVGSSGILSNINDSSTVTVSLYYEYGTDPILAPEPSTWIMMLLGFVGLGFAFSRRRPSWCWG